MHALWCSSSLLTDAAALTTGFADGAGQIWLNYVRCLGTEIRLIDCYSELVMQCSHSEDAGVRCAGDTCTQGAIRLQGNNATSGRVEICNRNAWGTVCSGGWGDMDAHVACRQLGFSSTGSCHADAAF